MWLPSGSLNVRTFKMKLRYTPYLCVGLQREAETVLSNDSDAVCSTAPFPRRKTGRKYNDMIVSGKFTSVQYGIYALENAHTRSITSLRDLPNVAFETVPIFV